MLVCAVMGSGGTDTMVVTQSAYCAAGSLGPATPPLAEEGAALTWHADGSLPQALERHLRDLYEADVIARLQVPPSSSFLAGPCDARPGTRLLPSTGRAIWAA